MRTLVTAADAVAATGRLGFARTSFASTLGRAGAPILALLISAPALLGADPGSLEWRAFGPVQPRWSPDLRQAAFSWQGAICSMQMDTGTVFVLTADEGMDLDPAWSPDGKTLAFVRSPGASAGVLQWIRADDGAAQALPRAVQAQGPLHFHPDGKRILGRFSAQGGARPLSWYDLATGQVAPVSDLPRGGMLSVYALPDHGQWLLFATHADLPGEQSGNNGPQADLWRIAPDGGRPEKIVRWPARIYGISGAGTNAACFIVTDHGASHPSIWHVPFLDALREARPVTSGLADEDWPSSTLSGRFVLHTDNAQGATALVLTDTARGSAQSLAMEELVFSPAYREDTAPVKLNLVDAATQSPVAARVSIQRKSGKFFAPVGALYRFDSRRLHFYARGEARLRIPSGAYEIIATRGPEYRIWRREIEARHGAENTIEIRLERWTDAAARHWYSGENHIHANYGYGAWYNTPSSILEMCEGEDLNVANLMVANSDGEGVFDRQFFRGGLDPLSTPRTLLYWNQEFRSTIWGHMTFGNLPRLIEPIFTGFKHTTNPWDVPTNADVAGRARDEGGVASYTHPAQRAEDPYDSAYAAKGLPVDVALQRIDTLDVMGWGYEASLQVWYRLLRCGFRLPAAAGTDCFLNRVQSAPPGWGRAYVHLPEGLDYARWIEGQRAGRSFITTGPMLEFAAGNATSGETIQLPAPGSVRVRARATAQAPLDRFEIILNGQVQSAGRMQESGLAFTIDVEIPVDRSGWVAVRAAGPGVQQLTTGRQVAHSNPVFLEVAGTQPERAEDVKYFLAWIDRLEADLRRRDRFHTGRSHVEQQLNAARDVFRKRM